MNTETDKKKKMFRFYYRAYFSDKLKDFNVNRWWGAIVLIIIYCWSNKSKEKKLTKAEMKQLKRINLNNCMYI